MIRPGEGGGGAILDAHVPSRSLAVLESEKENERPTEAY